MHELLGVVLLGAVVVLAAPDVADIIRLLTEEKK